MTSYQIYSTIEPTKYELVLVKFTEILDGYFKAELIEYPYTGIMNFQDASKKKKIRNWNNIITLNKNMVAQIEDINHEKQNVKLSLLFSHNQSQEELLVYFNENKLMERFISSFCIINKYDFNNIWYEYIHKLDISRRENSTNQSLWSYFVENINNLNFNNHNIENNLIELYDKRFANTPTKVITKFGLISTIGITIIINILQNLLLNFTNLTIKYDSAPYYMIESENIDITNEFIETLNIEINTNYNNKIFIKYN